MIDNFGKGAFGLDQLTGLIHDKPTEDECQNTIRYLQAQKREYREYREYLLNHPEVVAVHSLPQPDNSVHGHVYGETYLDGNGSKNMRFRIK